MDDESLNFGSPAAGATPGSSAILAQPPLQGDSETPVAQGEIEAQGELAGMFNDLLFTYSH
jgi:SWI/SNF related-matrix-associated actin-dependent regulator of chromatin subfamily C